MGKYLMLATLLRMLHKKVKQADPRLRDRLRSILDDVVAGGAIPLGMHMNTDGKDAYWWLVYDETLFVRSPDGEKIDRQKKFLEERTPLGVKMVILKI